MKKQFLLLTLLLSVAASALAEEAIINGLWYELESKTKEATVIQYKNDIKYRGNIVIPETVAYEGVNYSVTSIGDKAFCKCSSLISVTIPNSLKSMGFNAFGDCSGLTSVHISDIAAWCNIEFSDPSHPLTYAHHLYLGEEEITDLVIPNSVTTIKPCTFFCCSGLTSVTIPNSVTSIGEEAFSGCSGLTSVTIPNSVTSIKGSAFYDCNSLTSVTIPGGVTSIGSCTFGYCSGLTSVTIPNSVTSIGSGAFMGCSSLTSVTIPDGVTNIESSVFSGCSGLTSVTIPNSVTRIGGSAFSYCSGLTSVTIPGSVTSIGYNTFSGCSGLTSVTIPNSVTSIGDGAFNGCSGLTSVTIPGSVTSIGYNTFSGCSGLTSVTIPNSVTSIGDGAFNGCSSLTSVKIPDGVTSIGASAFQSCSSLTSITIGSCVETIWNFAFALCSKLTNLYCYAEKVPSTKSNALYESPIEHATLHVPTASINAYKAEKPWSGFKAIVGLDETTPEVKKCATPTILFVDGELEFSCVTEGVEYIYDITNNDVKSGKGSKVIISGAYTVSVYATKEGYENSDVATKEFILGTNGDVCDTNKDGYVDVSDISAILTRMASMARQQMADDEE